MWANHSLMMGRFLLLATLTAVVCSFQVESRQHGVWGKKWARTDGIPHQLAAIVNPEWGNLYSYNPSLKADVPIKVNVTAFVRLLGPVCTDKNTLSLQLTYRESFIDPRLEGLFSHKYYEGTELYNIAGHDFNKYLWMPDTFFRNSISEELLGSISQNTYARIHPNGKIMVSRRLQLMLACPNLGKLLKTDNKASCVLQIASYGHRKHDLEYQWATTNPVQTMRDSDFMLGTVDGSYLQLDNFDTNGCDVITATGTYSCIMVKFNFSVAKI